MKRHSLQSQLPLSYLLIALLTAVLLGLTVLGGLRVYYLGQDRANARQTAQLIAQNLSQVLADRPSAESLKVQVERLAQLTRGQVRLLDTQRAVLTQAGQPHSTRPFPPLPPLPPRPPLPENPEFLPLPALPEFRLETEPMGWLERILGRTVEVFVLTLNHPKTSTLLGFVEFSREVRGGGGILQTIATAWGLATLGVLALAMLVGWRISQRLTGPLLSLTETTRRLDAGELSARANIQAPNEIGLLANSFNQMADRLEATIASLRRFVGDAAHGLQTPLTALRSYLELGSSEPQPEQRGEYLHQAQGQLQRMQTLVNGLLSLSRLEQETNLAPVELVGLLEEERERYASQAEQKSLRLCFDLPQAALYIQGDAGQLRNAVENLLENALKFTPEGGQVRLSLERTPSTAQLAVEDTGIGIPAEDLPRVFERFFRGRNAASFAGSGLGLAIVKQIVDNHKGHIQVGTVENTRVVINFPLLEPSDM